MDIHRCKLCSRCFLNGRALGGHMKSHLSFRLPPPPTTIATLSSTAYDDVPAIYALRENPRKTIKFSNPDFEREAKSRDRDGSSRRRTRRSRTIGRDDKDSTEAEPVNSVSDASTEEDLAMCLMMLCRDDGWRNHAEKVKENGVDSNAQKKVHQWEICKKCFRSSQALGGHRIIHRKKVVVVPKDKDVSTSNKHGSSGISLDLNRRIFEGPFCGKEFGSGQALSGHKRSHLMASPGRFSSSAGFIINNGQNPTSAKNTDTTNNNNNSCIDLNLPAPTEDEDVYSVVSDDGGCNTPRRRNQTHRLFFLARNYYFCFIRCPESGSKLVMVFLAFILMYILLLHHPLLETDTLAGTQICLSPPISSEYSVVVALALHSNVRTCRMEHRQSSPNLIMAFRIINQLIPWTCLSLEFPREDFFPKQNDPKTSFLF